MFSGDSAFFRSVRSIIKKMHQISDSALKVYGISHSEMRIMLLLYAENSYRQEELAHALGIDRSNVGRSLKKLEMLGFVSRKRSPEDARVFSIILTEKGYSVRDRLEKIKRDIESTVTWMMPPDEVERASALIEAMDHNLSWENYEAVRKQERRDNFS